MQWWHWLLLIGIIGGIVFMVMRWRKSKQAPPAQKAAASPFNPKYAQGKTASGSAAFGYSKPSAERLTQIDNGLVKAFIAARARGFLNGFDPTTYQVALIPNTAPAGNIPSFLIAKRETQVITDPLNDTPRPGYDQSEFDLDPAPGQIAVRVTGRFSISHKGGSSFYTTQPAPETLATDYFMRLAVVDDPNMTETAVYYEAEHALALMNDPELYGRTAIHGLGEGHPFL